MANKVVITDCPWEDNSIERTILESSGFEVVRARCVTSNDVVEVCQDANALLVGWAPIDRNALQQLPCCRFIMRYGVGYDNIDVAAATRAGIAVANNPDYCVEEVATHTLSLILASHRQLSSLMRSVQSGEWDPLAVMSAIPQLREMVIGLVGLGRIGSRVEEMVRPLVAEVLVYDPKFEQANATPKNLTLVSFAELLSRSDYISIHSPLNAETRNLFSSEAFQRMKPNAYLINCSRGGIIDEMALINALQMGQIGGAALDVFSSEPLPLDHPLHQFPSVIITPHAAWYSAKADFLLRANPARSIVRFFAGEPVSLVNAPLRSPSDN